MMRIAQFIIVTTTIISLISCNSDSAKDYDNYYVDSINSKIKLQAEKNLRALTLASYAWDNIKFGTKIEDAKKEDIFYEAFEDTIMHSLQMSNKAIGNIRNDLQLQYLDEMSFCFDEKDQTISLVKIIGKPLKPNYMQKLMDDCRKLLNRLCDKNIDSIDVNDSISEFAFGYTNQIGCVEYASFATENKVVDILIDRYSIEHYYYYGYRVLIKPNYDIDIDKLQLLPYSNLDNNDSSNNMWSNYWTFIKYGILVIICLFVLIFLCIFVWNVGINVCLQFMKPFIQLDKYLEKKIGWMSDWVMAFIYALISLFLLSLILLMFQ